ncbi:ficolin-2-like [Asterias rubens]|uniref:ficolin-2-like n=1 Tax=Asterias rubens TaxID=7604 RepID=UPI001455ADC6|nr:ficolin-2-like [Asterias rubens]
MEMYVIVLYLVYMFQKGQCGYCQRFETEMVFHSANNRGMVNHTFQTKMVSSPVLCGRDCSSIPQCTSFNYNKIEGFCELNNATRMIYPADFVEIQGTVYYDENMDTVAFSLSDLDNSSCKMLHRAGHHSSGIHTIYPLGIPAGLDVYCDMATDGGGWAVFQRRKDGTVDFYRAWGDYQSGFGDPSGEFWLGNDILRKLTELSPGRWQLRVDLRDWDNTDVFATYNGFSVTGEDYVLHLDSYVDQGGAGDSLLSHNGRKFSTTDRDNDEASWSCADDWHGAWWYEQCFASHLNGVYLPGPEKVYRRGIAWASWKGLAYSLKECSMKIREIV